MHVRIKTVTKSTHQIIRISSTFFSRSNVSVDYLMVNWLIHLRARIEIDDKNKPPFWHQTVKWNSNHNQSQFAIPNTCYSLAVPIECAGCLRTALNRELCFYVYHRPPLCGRKALHLTFHSSIHSKKCKDKSPKENSNTNNLVFKHNYRNQKLIHQNSIDDVPKCWENRTIRLFDAILLETKR